MAHTFVKDSPLLKHRKMKSKLYKSIIVFGLILLPTVMFAPPIPPGPGGSTPVAPIDAGVGFLLVAGAAYGMRLIGGVKKH